MVHRAGAPAGWPLARRHLREPPWGGVLSSRRRTDAQRLGRRVAQTAASLALAAVLLSVVFPAVVGARWHAIGHEIGRLSAADFAVLTALWFAGLLAYTVVQAAALPGLSHRRALMLNLAGSGVANVVPFGGALGISLNYAMVRSWRFPGSGFAVFVLLTNLWNILTKLALPPLALVAVLVTGDLASPRLALAAAVGATALGLVVVASAAALSSERWAVTVGRGVETVVQFLLRVVRSSRVVYLDRAVLEVRHRTAGVIRAHWRPLSLGMIAYAALQASLLAVTLRLLGATLDPAEVFAGYAVERLLTLLVITPAGAGVAETGASALLVAFGTDPATAAAGVVLYRGFTFLIEIPIGFVVTTAWFLRRQLAGASPAADDGGPGAGDGPG